MYGWDLGYGGPAMLAAQLVSWLLVAAIIAAVVLLAFRLARPRAASAPDGRAQGGRALEILDERLARGGISLEEHERMRAHPIQEQGRDGR